MDRRRDQGRVAFGSRVVCAKPGACRRGGADERAGGSCSRLLAAYRADELGRDSLRGDRPDAAAATAIIAGAATATATATTPLALWLEEKITRTPGPPAGGGDLDEDGQSDRQPEQRDERQCDRERCETGPREEHGAGRRQPPRFVDVRTPHEELPLNLQTAP